MNASIKAAFERFWIHTVAKIGTKAEQSALDTALVRIKELEEQQAEMQAKLEQAVFLKQDEE